MPGSLPEAIEIHIEDVKKSNAKMKILVDNMTNEIKKITKFLSKDIPQGSVRIGGMVLGIISESKLSFWEAEEECRENGYTRIVEPKTEENFEKVIFLSYKHKLTDYWWLFRHFHLQNQRN